MFSAQSRLLSSLRHNVARRTGAPTAAFSTSAAVSESANTEMLCMQCEQTENGTGCTTVGICGKTPEVAAMQDVLVNSVKALGALCTEARAAGVSETDLADMNDFTLKSLYSTLTNVNFDKYRMKGFIRDCADLADETVDLIKSAGATASASPLIGGSTATGMMVKDFVELGESVGLQARQAKLGNDRVALEELVTYGLKGVAAYAAEAEDQILATSTVADMHDAMAKLNNPDTTNDELVGLSLKVGEVNVGVLAALDANHNEKFGAPEPTAVSTAAKKGPAILVSGHHMTDLKAILEQTKDKGVNVYTHGELMPANTYPELKKYDHLVGNYGGAWQLQKMEFGRFPGPVVVTTNCLLEPRKKYADRIFTTNSVGFEDVPHIADGDYSAVVEKALSMDGFKADEKPSSVTAGFGHKAVLGLADVVVNAVKEGDIKHFFLIGGCDGTEGERSYFRNLAQKTPDDSVILTLGCGKYRLIKEDLGVIKTKGGAEIPRILDMGQCNDAYSAVVVANTLAEVFKTDVNGLPLSFAVSWFEQKAVAILLSLLHLGVKHVRIGPALPAFIPADTLGMLVENFGLKPIGDVDEDLKNMLNNE